MTSAVRAFLPVTGDPEALVAAFDGDPDAWLASSRRDGATNRWVVPLRAGALRRNVRMVVGGPWRAGATRWRSLSWDPIGADGDAAALDRLLPSFDGELGLHVEGPDRATLVLDGRYHPPGGRFGTAVDTLALGRLAQLTATSLLAAIAAELTADLEGSGQHHGG